MILIISLIWFHYDEGTWWYFDKNLDLSHLISPFDTIDQCIQFNYEIKIDIQMYIFDFNIISLSSVSYDFTLSLPSHAKSNECSDSTSLRSKIVFLKFLVLSCGNRILIFVNALHKF